MIQDYQIQEFLRQAHRVGDAGLTLCSSGNISWRIGDEALVSGTGSWVPTLPKEKVSICRVADGEVLNSALMLKHGQVVCGKTFDEVFERAMFFEMACRIIVLSQGHYNTLTPEEIDDLEAYVLGKVTK